MIIYEVNLKVNHDCVIEFKSWLMTHMQKMLSFDGFKKVQLYQVEKQENTAYVEWVVMYSIDNMESLDHYFNHQASAMREEGLIRFPNQFTATRRILKSI